MLSNGKKKLFCEAEKRRKIKEIKNNELNKQCFDCGSCFPEYISINNGVFICKDCLIIHNKFTKQISTTLKNNLSSLNSKELQFMYLGGNQKLLEFINYEYPQLHKFKLNILYQTKAMEYYRNNLYYLIYGGAKPIKPNEKINAYELISPNDLIIKNEKINNKINKINKKNSSKEKKRNISVGRLVFPNSNNNKMQSRKNKNIEEYKINTLSYVNDEENLKRHKSFYKEMNKLFGPELNKDLYEILTYENNIYKKQKIKKDNYKRKRDLDINNENNKLTNSNENNNNSKFNGCRIEHIYNNNFYTLSATKNIFMFTPNKDNMIYKFRKTNLKKNKNFNNNLEEIPIKKIYYKPKIPYLIHSNRKNLHNNLFFSLNIGENEKVKLEKEIRIIDTNDIESFGIYSKANIKNKTNENPKEMETNNISQKDEINNDKKNDNHSINNKNNNNENEIININNKKDKISIFFRNKKIINNQNTNEKLNKTELKKIKIDKIIKTKNENFHNKKGSNDIDIQEINKRVLNGVNGRKIKYNSNKSELFIDKTDKIQNNSIIIDVRKEEISNLSQKIESDKEIISKNKNKNSIITNQIIKDENQDNNNIKLFIEKRSQRLVKILGDKKEEKNNNIDYETRQNKKFRDYYNNKKMNEKALKEDEFLFHKEENQKENIIVQKERVESRILDKNYNNEIIKDINRDSKKSKGSSINEKKEKINNDKNNIVRKIEQKKFSIRNKYKMKKINENKL